MCWFQRGHGVAQYLSECRRQFFGSAVLVDIGVRSGPQTARSVLVLGLDTHHDHRELAGTYA